MFLLSFFPLLLLLLTFAAAMLLPPSVQTAAAAIAAADLHVAKACERKVGDDEDRHAVGGGEQ